MNEVPLEGVWNRLFREMLRKEEIVCMRIWKFFYFMNDLRNGALEFKLLTNLDFQQSIGCTENIVKSKGSEIFLNCYIMVNEQQLGYCQLCTS